MEEPSNLQIAAALGIVAVAVGAAVWVAGRREAAAERKRADARLGSEPAGVPWAMPTAGARIGPAPVPVGPPPVDLMAGLSTRDRAKVGVLAHERLSAVVKASGLALFGISEGMLAKMLLEEAITGRMSPAAAQDFRLAVDVDRIPDATIAKWRAAAKEIALQALAERKP